MEETYSKWPEWQKVYVNIKILTPGLFTCIKTGINTYKIRLQRYFFETCNKWAEWQCLSVDIRILSTNGCLPLPWGYIYIHVEKHLKMHIKSEFKEIFLKLATNGRSGKSFLLTSKFLSQGFVCPCSGAIFMYKIIKKCVSNQNSKSPFWNLQQMVKVIWAFCWRQNFVTRELSAPGFGLYTCMRILKNIYKIRLQSDFFLNLQQMVKMMRPFCWHQKFIPKGLSALAPGLYTYIKIIKNVYKIRLFF